jgi:hypothetical protein
MRYSEQQAFNNCPYKYRLTKEGLKKQKDARSEHHKLWGQAIHSALEAHYKGLPFPAVEKAFRDVYPVNLDEADGAKTVENGVEVLRQYASFYAEQDKIWEVLGTEVEGTTDIGDEEHGLHIDLIARHKQTGEIYFWDHKTSGKEPGVLYWKNYELSAQVTRYTVWVKEKFGACAGCYINNIALKHLLRKNKYGEGPGLVVRFERQLFNRTPQQIDFWRESDEGWMKMIEFCQKENVWPRSFGSLCAYCEFYDLCLASGDEQIKELLYKQETEFNPVVE